MEVCAALTGETLAVLETNEFEGKSVKDVKELLTAHLGIPRFRQRLLGEDRSKLLDDMVLEAPVKIYLLKQELVIPDAQQAEQMVRSYQSACRGSLLPLEELLEIPLDPDVADDYGTTHLGHAANDGHLDIARLLLEARANTEHTDKDGKTPLLLAGEKGYRESDVARMLVEAGANMEHTDTDGQTPLWFAARMGYLGIARMLVAAGANKEHTDKDGLTPLGIAAACGNLDIARLLLKAGANKEHTDKDGLTPLGLAVKEGYFDIARMLVFWGAKIFVKLVLPPLIVLLFGDSPWPLRW